LYLNNNVNSNNLNNEKSFKNLLGNCPDYRLCRTIFAQDSANIKTPLALGKIEPYRMEVTYDKTSHLIFPTAIRYVDLGSEYLIAGKRKMRKTYCV
jgi:hypothetical protein